MKEVFTELVRMLGTAAANEAVRFADLLVARSGGSDDAEADQAHRKAVQSLTLARAALVAHVAAQSAELADIGTETLLAAVEVANEPPLPCPAYVGDASTLSVSELRDALADLPDNAPVLIAGGQPGIGPVANPELSLVTATSDGSAVWLADEGDVVGVILRRR